MPVLTCSRSVVLYEMATGQTPFQGSSAGEFLGHSPDAGTALETESPAPLQLERLVRKPSKNTPVTAVTRAPPISGGFEVFTRQRAGRVSARPAFPPSRPHRRPDKRRGSALDRRLGCRAAKPSDRARPGN